MPDFLKNKELLFFEAWTEKIFKKLAGMVSFL